VGLESCRQADNVPVNDSSYCEDTAARVLSNSAQIVRVERTGMNSRRPGKQVMIHIANGKRAKKWTKIGAAFPRKEALGFCIELKVFPIDGRLLVLPPDTDGNRQNEK
jgi:hypothetical protein